MTDGTGSGLGKIAREIKEKPLAPTPDQTVQVGDKKVTLTGELPTYERRPPAGFEQYNNLNEIPNYDKLTRTERWVMDRLPGFSESKVGQALASFGESWLGKVLAKLDVPAEGIERLGGFAAQALAAVGTPESWQEFTDNLGAAWYAGSLAADMTNLPQWDGENQRFIVPTDLPGIEGVVTARQQIAALIDQGVDPGEALIQVRDSFYDTEGALALRSQLHDAFLHIVGDPLNYVLPAIKPVEATRAWAQGILNRAARMPEHIQEATKIATEALEAAVRVGNVDDAAKAAQEILKIEQAVVLSPSHQKILQLFGMLPTDEPAKVPGLLKLFQLTPESRAMDYGNMIYSNFTTRVMFNESGRLNDPVEIVRAIERIAEGQMGPEFAHTMVTIEGRAVRSELQGFQAIAQDLLKSFDATTNERQLLEAIASHLDVDPYTLMQRLKNGEETAVLQQFSEALLRTENEGLDVLARLGKEDVTLEDVAKIARTFQDSEIYTEDLFGLTLANKFSDHLAQSGVALAGVEARGFLPKFADMVKTAETLGFLRLNPGYPIRNFINNEFTMIARGVWGLSERQSEKLIKRLGFEPPRLRVGTGPAEIRAAVAAGDVGKIGESAYGTLVNGVRSAANGEKGWVDKVTDVLRSVKLGKADMGQIAAEIERRASIRAHTAGYIRGWRKHFWKPSNTPGVGFTLLRDFSPDAVEKLGDDVIRAIERQVQSAMSEVEIDAGLQLDNIEVSSAAVLEGASQELGVDIANILDADFTEEVMPGIVDAARRGPTALKAELGQVKTAVQNHLDNLVDESLQVLIDETASSVATEGPGAYMRLWGDVVDDWYGTAEAHSMNITQLADAAREVKDAAAANALWENIFDRTSRFMSRGWNRFEARMQGMANGVDTIISQLDDAGKLTPELRNLLKSVQNEVMGNFRQWRGGWEEFFTFRNTELGNFFRARLEGKEFGRSYDQIVTELNTRYQGLINAEDDLTRRIDDLIGKMLPEENRAIFKTWRDAVAEGRRADKEAVMAFRQRIQDLPADERQAAYYEHWQQRMQAWQEIAQEERAGLAALAGDQAAQARYAQRASDINLVRRARAGEKLNLEDKARVAEIVQENATEQQLGRLQDIRASEEAGAVNYASSVAHADERRLIENEILDRVAGLQDGRIVHRPQDITSVQGDFVEIAGRPGLLRGKKVLPSELGQDEVYHVTAHGDAIRESGFLRAAGGEELGGLGGGQEKYPGVSFSRNIQDAENVQREMQRVVRASQGEMSVADFQRFAEEDARLAGLVPEERISIYRGEGPENAGGRWFTTDAEAAREYSQLGAEGNVVSGHLPDANLAGADEIRAINIELGGDPEEALHRMMSPEEYRYADAIIEELKKRGYEGVHLPQGEDFAPSGRPIESYMLFEGLPEEPLASSVRNVENVFRIKAERVLAEQGFEDILNTEGVQLSLDELERLMRQYAPEQYSSIMYDTLRQYRISRSLNGGLDDPIILGDWRVFAQLDPASVEIMRVPTDRLADSGALVLRDVQAGDFLSEIRIFGDVPLEQPVAQIPLPFMQDFHSTVPREMYMGTGMDQLWFTRGDEALDAIGRSARSLAKKKTTNIAGLSDEGKKLVENYATHVKGQMSDARYASSRFGEWMRDSALLNYNRRYNYNTYLGMMAPYEFWATQTVFKTALHSIDRPAMLTSYLRIQKFLETAFRPEQGLPSRLKGTIRVNLPFLPDWMNKDLFVDPLRVALPYKQFAMPFEQARAQEAGDIGTAERVLQELLNDGDISQEEYDQASGTHKGPAWERAIALARQDDTEGRMNGFDFMSMLTSPHAPLLWAYNAARGTPDQIQPFLPITRSIKGISALLGVGPAGGINPEAAIRRELGLPEFDQWDPYRIDRMLSNMAATGEISASEALRAMIDRTGPIFLEAKRKAGIEYGIGALGSTIGMPLKAYPVGEENLRKLKDDYEAAWARYEQGDAYAIREFNDAHPEYETRLALFKAPEERLRTFLIDELWNQYNDMPTINKQEVRDQLGDLFQNAFLSRETRSYENIPLDQLQVWVKLMGGDPPGMATTMEGVSPLQLTNPDVAYRLDAFYKMRQDVFRYNDNVWPLWDQYFKLEEGQARRDFWSNHPILEQYLNWRNDFMYRNPTLTPYIEDDPDKRPKYGSEQELLSQLNAEPQFTWLEWQNLMGSNLSNLVLDYYNGDEMPEIAKSKLAQMGERLGLGGDWSLVAEYIGSSGVPVQ